MFILVEGFQPKSVFILLLFSMRCYNFLMAKITREIAGFLKFNFRRGF